MVEEEASAVFQHMQDESAVRILQDLPSKAGATAVKNLPTLRTANLLSGMHMFSIGRNEGMFWFFISGPVL